MSVLQPWTRTLCALSIQPTADDDGVWIQWLLLSKAPPSKLLQELQYIELLVLLAWSDSIAWRNVIAQVRAGNIEGFARHWETLVLEPRRTPRVLGVDIVHYNVEDAQKFCDFLSSPADEQSALDHHAVRMLIKPDYDRIAIPVRLRLSAIERSTQRDSSAVFPSLAVLAALQARLESSSNGDQSLCRLARSQIRIQRFYNDTPSSSLVDESSLRLLGEIWSHGIRVMDLPPLKFPLEPGNRRSYVRTLQSLFGIGQEGCVRQVSFGALHEETVAPSLLSTLADSPIVRGASVNFDELETYSRLWSTRHGVQWMAFALFTTQAKNASDRISME